MPLTLSSPKLEEINEDEAIFVITRTGKKELLDTNKIIKRLQNLIEKKPRIRHINPYDLMLKVVGGLKSGITTSEIDEYTADAAASMSLTNPYYMKLAGRIVVDNHQKNTCRSITDKMRMLYLNRTPQNKHVPMVSEEFFKYIEEHQDIIEKNIDHLNDFLVDYFGFRTYERIYGFKIDKKVIDRPQDTYMRTAVALHMNTTTLENDLKNIFESYMLYSTKALTQASPTYFNAGTNRPQFASCFLLGTEDSIEGIYKTNRDMAIISKLSGGIGVHVHNVRSNGTSIAGRGQSKGIVVFLKSFNSTMFAVDQGGNRKGAAAVYLMPHHPDIIAFLELKLKNGREEDRARDLFYALWCPDIFMRRVADGSMWSLFDPHETEDLSQYYDESNDKSYTKKYLELEAKYPNVKRIPAREIWEKAYESNQDSGMPYLCFSDTVNRLSMQKNLGVIKSSNLCAEITLYSDHKEYAVCNLCSISMSACVLDKYTDEELALPEEERRELDHEFPINPYFDFEKLQKIVTVATTNLNNVIDKSLYPVKETKRSNMRHRPIGIGEQGLADAYIKMRFPFDSPEARKLNKLIAETYYYAALAQSTKICRKAYQRAVKECKQNGSFSHVTYVQDSYKPVTVTYTNYKDIPEDFFAYPSMKWNGGSPISKGIFHWELAGLDKKDLSGMYDWESLREHIRTYGVRNSLLIALMPTASTSQFLGNNEGTEPYTTNIYKRKTLAGEFIVINKYLIHDMFKLGIWTPMIKDYLLVAKGSIQAIENIPEDLKNLYKTAYELDPTEVVRQAIDRQPFVDQAQSLNWFIEDLDIDIYTELAFMAWKGGLKTGKYYLHSEPAAEPLKFTVDASLQKKMMEMYEKEKEKRKFKFIEPSEEVCLVCHS
jgi:ribonucleoside-diphosphate reductase alpha chain